VERRPHDSWLLDLVAFGLSTAAHAGQRAARQGLRHWRLHRRLRGTRDILGAVEVLRPLQAPISRAPVAACRLIVEQRLEDGTWQTIFDETQAGELLLLHEEGPVQLRGPLELVVPPTGTYPGIAVAGLIGPGVPPADEEDLRATEHQLAAGDRVYLLGLIGRAPRQAGGSPYREPPARADHRWRGPALISRWSRRELLGMLWRGSDQLPPALRGSWPG